MQLVRVSEESYVEIDDDNNDEADGGEEDSGEESSAEEGDGGEVELE